MCGWNQKVPTDFLNLLWPLCQLLAFPERDFGRTGSGAGGKLGVEVSNFLGEKPGDGNAQGALEIGKHPVLDPLSSGFNAGQHIPADVQPVTLQPRRQSFLRQILLRPHIGDSAARDILPAHTIALLNVRVCLFDRETQAEGISECFCLRRECCNEGNEVCFAPEWKCPETCHNKRQFGRTIA